MIKRINPKKKYRIVAKSEYFYNKYGSYNPIITDLQRDNEIFGDVWVNRMRVPAVVSFMIRQVSMNGDIRNTIIPAYYGRIEGTTPNMTFGLKELVFRDELELITDH